MTSRILLPVLGGAALFLSALGAGESFDKQIATAAETMRGQLSERRRDFHIHPELSNREERTSRIVAEQLRSLGFTDIQTNVAKYGVVAVLKGGKPGPVVAVRADMDALPIQEVNEVPYKSQNPGVKHACGHDAHTAIQLGVAEVLSRLKDQLPGTVKFIFQPAEEGVPPGESGGANQMVKDGVLENPRPAAIFGLHCWPQVEVGQIAYASGPAMASTERIEITIHGKMAHGGAYPHRGIDAVVVAAEAVTSLQTIRSRKVDTQEPLVISIGTIQGGNRYNIVADTVKMEGTIRTLNEDVRQQIPGLMNQVLAGVTSAHGATYELKFLDSNPLTYNDPALVAEMLPTLERMVGPKNVVPLKPSMGGEDFAYYQKVIPGFFYWLGVSNKAKGITAYVHTPDFDIDEESLVIGVKAMSNLVVDYLQRHAGAAR